MRAKLCVMVRRILKKYGYPPDLCEEATRTVMEQAELLAQSRQPRPTAFRTEADVVDSVNGQHSTFTAPAGVSLS